MNLKLIAGRDLSKDYVSDSVGYLVNESALKVINYKDPIGKRLTFWGKKGTIVGVLKDFHFSSLHDPKTRKRMGRNGRAASEKDYNWGAMKEKLCAVYRSLNNVR